MTNFMLVHGAWHGGWCWRGVAERLRAAGHRVATPTLTGLAERHHLLDDRVDLETHITDVVNTARWEEFDRFVLCGHSYGGMVITGVAEQLETAVRGVVYLDAIIPENGQSAAAAARFQLPPDLMLDPPPVDNFAIADAEKSRWVAAMMTPHPTKTITQPLTMKGAYQRIPNKTFVLASGYNSPPLFRESYDRVRLDPSWKTHDVKAGHHLMLDAADLVVDILVDASR